MIIMSEASVGLIATSNPQLLITDMTSYHVATPLEKELRYQLEASRVATKRGSRIIEVWLTRG